MLNIRKILFPTDYSACAEHAFDHVAHLADRYDAEVHVLHVAYPTPGAIPDALYQFRPGLTEDDVARDLHLAPEPPERRRYAKGWAHSMPILQVDTVHLDPVAAIAAYATRHDIDVIVMGTHGRRGLGRLLIGSVAEGVVRRAPCPVLTVRERSVPHPGPGVERLLVPFDFSDHARAALAHAATLADAYGAQIDLLHVIEESVLPHVYGIEPIAVPAAALKARNEAALAEVTREAGMAGVEAVPHVVVGHAPSDIVAFAERHGSGLVVIATHGRTGLARAVLGSVAEYVVRRAPCPVFTVKRSRRAIASSAPAEAAADAVAGAPAGS